MNNRKIVTSYEDLAPVEFRHTAVFDGYCGAPDSDDYCGTGKTPADAVCALIHSNNCECEYDCAEYCLGCDRWFHDIKIEHGLDHRDELPESYSTNSGHHYCHSDCGRK